MNFFKNDNTFLRSAKNCVFQPSSYPQYYCECGNFENFGRFWEILGNFGKFWDSAAAVHPISNDRPPVALHRRGALPLTDRLLRYTVASPNPSQSLSNLPKPSQSLSQLLTASHFFRCLIVVYCRFFADYRGCILCFARRTARECTTVLDRVSIAARHKMRRENRKIKKNLRLR